MPDSNKQASINVQTNLAFLSTKPRAYVRLKLLVKTEVSFEGSVTAQKE